MPSMDQQRKRLKKLQKDFVEDLKIGEFTGKFRLEWNGPETFKYHPDEADPFRYVRNLGNNKKEVIEPGPMVTNGGSIPLVAQVLTGRTPWEYGPAYLIHDWEFHRHHVDSSFKKSFKQVNLTLAESIWTLMNKGYLNYKKPMKNFQNVHTVYTGVSSPVGRAIWNAEE